ncbi:MFS transporter [Micromonospora sp. MS34]|uniref:MFS transporter n=1 Tax=Micromonospora sp. MS34 TaxID=3385971 RepID=UPI0039A14969
MTAPEAARTWTERRPASLWRNRDYMCWWTGTALSLLGSNVSVVAFPLLVLFGGGSVLDAGLIAAAERVGALLSRLWGGALADRHPRRAILIGGPLAQAVLMGVVAWLVYAGHVVVPVLTAIALVAGLLAGIGSSATLPAMRRLVPREQFASRAAQEQGLQQATQLAGAPLAGLLFGIARWLPFGFDALSFVAASIGIALIGKPLGPDPDPAAGRRGRGGLVADIRQGLRIVVRQPFLRYTTAWVAVTNLVGNSVILLGMALLEQQGHGPRTISVTNAVILAGGVVGAIVAGRIVAVIGSRRVFLLGNWAYVFSLGLVALTRTPWQLALAAALFVFASVPTAAVWEAYVATLVPDELSGRVGATTSCAAQSLTWVGALLAGVLADQFGARTALACFAALLVPFTIANHTAKALQLMRTPLARLAELSSDPPQLRRRPVNR